MEVLVTPMVAGRGHQAYIFFVGKEDPLHLKSAWGNL